MAKRTVCVAALVISLVSLVYGVKLGTLDKVYKPQMIKADGDDLFIVEGHKIHIYTRKDLKYKMTLGKEGEGPGEFNLDPARTLVISVFPDYILAESRNKVVYFNRQGKFIKEFRKQPTVVQTLPLGKHYIFYKILYGPEGKNYFALSLHDAQMKELRELYRQKFFVFEDTTFIMPDAINFCIFQDKVFWEESPDGFRIAAVDSNGKDLARIEMDFVKLPVTEPDKKTAFDLYMKNPSMLRLAREQGKEYVDNFLKQIHMVYPDHFPAVRDIISDPVKQLIYIKTYQVKNDKEEYQVMDIKGNEGKILKTIYLPQVQPEPFFEQLQGSKKYYTIHNGQFFYLKMVFNADDEEEWEVHAESL